MPVTIRKWGDCLAIRLPKALAKSWSIREGTRVQLQFATGGILLRPVHPRKKTLKDFLANMKGPNPHGEIDIDGPRR